MHSTGQAEKVGGRTGTPSPSHRRTARVLVLGPPLPGSTPTPQVELPGRCPSLGLPGQGGGMACHHPASSHPPGPHLHPRVHQPHHPASFPMGSSGSLLRLLTHTSRPSTRGPLPLGGQHWHLALCPLPRIYGGPIPGEAMGTGRSDRVPKGKIVTD